MTRPLHAVRDPIALEREWTTSPRWKGVRREYSAEDALRLRGSIDIEYTLAEMGAQRLWGLLRNESYVSAPTCQPLCGVQWSGHDLPPSTFNNSS
jgi:isocitrate lyase